MENRNSLVSLLRLLKIIAYRANSLTSDFDTRKPISIAPLWLVRQWQKWNSLQFYIPVDAGFILLVRLGLGSVGLEYALALRAIIAMPKNNWLLIKIFCKAREKRKKRCRIQLILLYHYNFILEILFNVI